MGSWTRACIGVGLAVFVVLAFWPGKGLHAVYAMLITPLLATLATSAELVSRRRIWPALSLVCALTLIAVAVWWSSR